MPSSAPPVVSEPVKYALYAPNERGLYVRKKSSTKIRLTAEIHRERLESLQKMTEDLAKRHAEHRKFLKLPPFEGSPKKK